MRAYVLVNAKPGKARDIARQIANFHRVRRADVWWSVPDIFVEVQVASADELNELVMDEIEHLEGVERTETRIAAE